MRQLQKTTAILVAFIALVACTAQTQTYLEWFNHANGNTIPGWSMEAGAWTINNKQLVAEPRGLWQYITVDGFTTKNGMVEVTAVYNNNSTMKLQFGGGALRFISTSTNVMNKTQDNNSSGDFDRFFVYDQPGGSKYVDPTPHKMAVIRLGALDNDIIGKIDIDQDGRWDHVVVKPTTQTPCTGKVGIAGYGGCILDDFKYFDAIVRIDPQGLNPAPGNLTTIELRGTANLTYQCACSFTNAVGIHVDSRRIPLDPDDLMVISFQLPLMFQKFSGVLDTTGAGMAGIHLPAIPALKGVWFYLAMITLDPTARNGIRNISNDLRIEIQ